MYEAELLTPLGTRSVFKLKKEEGTQASGRHIKWGDFINRWTAQMEVTAALQPAADNAVLIVLIFL